jgi:hypothetical protein
MRDKSVDVPSLLRESIYRTLLEEEDDDVSPMTSPMAMRSLGTVYSGPPKYRGLSTAPLLDPIDDECDEPVYRSATSTKRGMVIHEATRMPRAPPTSPAMRVRSYDAAISKDQMTRLFSRVMA